MSKARFMYLTGERETRITRFVPNLREAESHKRKLFLLNQKPGTYWPEPTPIKTSRARPLTPIYLYARMRVYTDPFQAHDWPLIRIYRGFFREREMILGAIFHSPFPTPATCSGYKNWRTEIRYHRSRRAQCIT